MSRELIGRLCAIVALVFSLPQVAAAYSTHDPAVAAICESAAEIASRESGVPVDVLRAISLTETGRQHDGDFLPWPWTVNMEGVGKWFKDVGDAQRYVDKHFARGARSFDVGCFQINYRWHGKAFSSIEEMFDPISNARYAAKFLSELYQELGDWSKAAGAYHSRTPKYARKYAARFDRIRAKLPDFVPVTFTPEVHSVAVVSRRNAYPFFQDGRATSAGSLVPLDNARVGRLFGDASPRPIIEFR